MKKNIKYLAFSLVELMISLITISLITAALAPVITKKLSVGTITVGSFGGSGNVEQVCENALPDFTFKDLNGIHVTNNSSYVTIQSDASYFKIKFLQSGTLTINNSDYTIDAFAVGGGGGGGYDGGGGGGGYTKTEASKILKKDITYLITVGDGGASDVDGEASSIKLQSNNSDIIIANGGKSSKSAHGGNGGSGGAASGSGTCKGGSAGTDGSNGGNTINCGDYNSLYKGGTGQGTTTREFGISTETLYSGGGGGASGLRSASTWTYGGEGGGGRGGVTTTQSVNGYPGTPNTGGGGGGGAGSGSGGKGGSGIVIIKGVPQEVCTGGSGSGGGSSLDMGSVKKTVCDMLDTKYWDESEKACKTCSDDIPNCEKCSNGTTCEKCASGYQLVDGTCSDTSCPRATMQIGDLCVTQYNIGDHDNYRLPNANSVDYLLGVYNVGSGDSACKANYTTGCCWKGATSGTNCDSANGSYSGCNRTVCNWYAADNLCKNISIEGFSGWRLPTIDELKNFNPDTYSKSNSPNPGDNGLMFCDVYANYNSARCLFAEVCPGSVNGYCNPDYVWSETLDGSTYAFNRSLNSGSWNSNSSYRTHPLSVRCVIDMCKLNYQNCQTCTNEGCSLCNEGYYLTNGYCKKLTTVPNCLSYSSIEDKCTACNAGYGYSDGTCTACTSGTYSAGGTMACTSSTTVSNCATYSTTSDVCTACNSGYNLTSGNCVASCVCSNGSCGSGSSVCTTCNAKYYLSNGSCAICPAGYYCTGGTADKIACSTLGKMYHAAEGQSSCGNCATEAGGIYSSTIGSPVCTGVNHALGHCTCLGCVSGYYLLNGLCYASH